jgi:plasmid replication initiation protein
MLPTLKRLYLDLSTGAFRTMKTNNVVVKANVLIEASYRLTLNEQRLILLAISKVNPLEKLTEGRLFSVSVDEWMSCYECSYSSANEAIKEAEYTLFERQVTLLVGEDSIKTRWVQSIRYYKRQGKIGIRFAYDLLPYLAELNSHFTTYKIKEICDLSSIYSVRLFEMISQFKDINKSRYFVIRVDDFKNRLGIQGEYPLFANLKQKVIEVAVNQIKEHTEFKNIKYELEKEGRKVVRLVFFF